MLWGLRHVMFMASLLSPLVQTGAASFAVCITGGSRTFSSAVVAKNIKSQLVDALPGHVDVLVVFPVEELSGSAQLQASLQILAPLYVAFYSELGYDDKCARAQLSAPSSAANFFSQWSKVQVCYEAMRTHELVTGVRYDFFVRVRPDLFFFANVSTWLQLSDTVIQAGEMLWLGGSCSTGVPINDHFAVVPRSLAHAYASAASVLVDCTVTNAQMLETCHDCGVLHQECFLSYHLRRLNVSYNACHQTYGGSTGYLPALTSPESLWTVTRQGANAELILDRFSRHDVLQLASWKNIPPPC
jgi:hypothetical protein